MSRKRLGQDLQSDHCEKNGISGGSDPRQIMALLEKRGNFRVLFNEKTGPFRPDELVLPKAVQDAALQFDPVFHPANRRIGPIPVPYPRKQNKERSRRDWLSLAFARFETAPALADINKLVFVKNPAALP